MDVANSSFDFSVDADVSVASLPPPALYIDPAWFAAIQSRVLRSSWSLLPQVGARPQDGSVVPVDLHGEPAVLCRDAKGVERLLSNVCTHRGAVVVDAPCRTRHLRCPYHGRKWSLDGRFAAAPGFEGARDFPTKRDDLAELALGRFGPWRFGGVDPGVSFSAWMNPVAERLPWFPWDQLVADPASDRDYLLDSNWALYVDNYLEGFHVPFVHPGLAAVLDPTDYRHELLPLGTLQLGLTRDPADAFDVPAGERDAGQPVGGYYFWLFPTTMLNIYPWGVSLNLVEPLGVARTRVRYRAWVCDPARRGTGAGGALDSVELEDQAVVARAQAGVRSHSYRSGRYAPQHEAGLHHFHRILAHQLR